MAATGARIEAYSYSDSSARWISTNRLGVNVGAGVVYVRHTTPMLLEDQLADWETQLDAAVAAGAPWSLTYSTSTRRVTIARSGVGNVALTLPGSLGRWLGFTGASYAGSPSYTGEAAPAGLVQCMGVDSEIAEIHERVELSEYRHARAVATVWGRMDRFEVTAWVRRDQYPWQAGTAQTADDDPKGGWVLTGRVRVHQSSGGNYAYSETRTDGWIDGFVVGCTADLEREDDGLLRLRLVIVAPYAATGVAEPTGFWGAVRYGWSPVYCLTLAGVPVVWCERETGKTLAAGYTESAALVIDDSSSVGSIIDRERGIGVGLSLGFKLLDTGAMAGYMVRPTAATYLAGNMTATGAGAITVGSTAAFNATGAIHIGAERIEHTGKTATTFTGITRGTAGSRKVAHKKGSASQTVTNTLRFWQGRDVRLSAVPADPSGYVTGTALVDDEVEIWRGRIASAPLRSFDGWNFSADALDRVLEKRLAAKITGKVLGFEACVVVSPGWTATLTIDGVDATGASVWAAGPYSFVLDPFDGSGYVAGDVISVGEMRSLLNAAWAAQVTALGAGADLGADLLWQPVGVAGPGKGFEIRPHALPNVAMVSVGVYASKWGGYTPEVIKFQPVLPPAAEGWYPYVGFQCAPNILPPFNWQSSQTLAVELDEGLPADVPTDGYIKATAGDKWQIFKYTGATAVGGLLYLGALDTVGADALPVAKFWEDATVELWAQDGPADLAVLMLDAIQSSGGGTMGTYDTLSQGAGYAIEFVDEGTFTQKIGAFGIVATVSEADTSFADLFGGALALCRAAVVQRSDTTATDLAVGLACVDTAADGSDWQTEITDWHLLHMSEEPVTSVTRLEPPNAIVATRIICNASGEAEQVHARDVPAIQDYGATTAEWSVPADSRDDLQEVVETRAPQHFFAEQSAQAVVLRVPPWVVAEPGDLVRLTDLTHPSLWDYAAGSAGYDGVARIVGRALSLRTCTVELTALLGGQFKAAGLSPSAGVLAFAGAAGAPTSIDVHLKFLPHFSTAITKAGGAVPVLHYEQGNGEGTAQRYSISAAVSTGGICRLTVAGQTGVFNVVVARSWLTLPPTGTFGATSYQDGFAHVSDGTVWL